MEAQLNQPKTFSAQDFAQTFFRQVPTDQRFLQNTYQKVPPSTSIGAKTIEFNLSRFEAANVYQIQDAHLEVTIKITKSDGTTLPDKLRNVAPVNNVLHSMWETVRVTVNDDYVTKNPNFYPYKAYITNCLTYSSAYKAAQLCTEGYYQDLHNHMGPVTSNSGFIERNLLFRIGNTSGADYNPVGVRFFGRLHLDYLSVTTGFPPGTKVKIELDRSSDDFVLMKETTDVENYKLILINCNLFIPIAQLSAPLFSEIGSTFAHQSMSIHFRRIDVKVISLAKDKEEINTDILFQSDMPCRIILCFIESDHKTGTQTTNPFDFKRHWIKVSGVDQVNESTLKERLLEERLNKVQEQLNKFQSFLNLDDEMLRQINEFQTTRKSPSGRGKRSQPATSTSFLGRFRHSFSSGN